MAREKMVCQSTILEMGWTKSMIARLLPEPTLRPNPYSKEKPPMKLWREEDVLACMETEEYKALHAKSEKRSRTAQVAHATATKSRFTPSEVLDFWADKKDRRTKFAGLNPYDDFVMDCPRSGKGHDFEDELFQFLKIVSGFAYSGYTLILRFSDGSVYGFAGADKYFTPVSVEDLPAMYARANAHNELPAEAEFSVYHGGPVTPISSQNGGKENDN